MTEAPVKIKFETPIVRESVAEMVVRRILGLVKSGALKPGDLLPTERDLATSLDVSRPSVREAMRGLAVLGVVRTRHGGGASISDLGPDRLLSPLQFYLSLQDMNIQELYDARELIESDVARRAALNLDAAAIERLEALYLEQTTTTDNPEAFRLTDFKFHQTLWIGANNAFLKRIGEALNVIGLEFRKQAWEQPGVLERSLRDHRRLIDAIAARDPQAAAQAAALHMRNVFKSSFAPSKATEEGT